MSVLETIAIVFSLLSVILAIKQNKHTWSTGIIGILAYAFIFFKLNLYVNFGLQFIFLAQSFWGYTRWNQDSIKITTDFNYKTIIVLVLPIYSVLYYFFKNYSNNPEPFLDTTATILSMVATYLLMVGKKENWLVWIVVDVLYIVLFWNQNLIGSSILYVIFLILAVKGYLTWRNQHKLS